ncbi:MAG TPA: mechanosensitive ion channel family protein [Thermoanaerobaculia bacterium]|nr:mechanosensitive ion channel family protein [Thermoanaerobaculia bacterium]
MEWLEWTLLDNSVRAWLTTLSIIIGSLLVVGLFKLLFIPRLRRAHQTETPVDDFLYSLTLRTRLFLLLFVIAFFAIRPLSVSLMAVRGLRVLAIIAAFLQIGLWSVTAIEFWLERYRHKRLASDAAAVTTLGAIGFVSKLALWVVLVLLTLDNLGIDVTALIAGLGIGGVAIALATQNILGDLFASLSIVIDKPFIIGDFIVVGEYRGTVEHIGLKSTRIRSLSGEQLVFSNSDLLESRIRNFKRMQERRVVFEFGVVYQTPASALERIPGMVRRLIEEVGETRFDRAHFKGFGDSSLDFEAVYFVLDADFNRYMDTQQTINLGLVRVFEAEGLEFAYPTRTLYLEGSTGDRGPAIDERT